MSKPYDILSLGSIYLDINAIGFPFRDGLQTETETVGDVYVYGLGGSSVICVQVGASLGLHNVFIGKVGKDDFGNLLEKQLKQYGITSFVIKDEHVQTNVSLNYTNTEGKTLRSVLGSANQALQADEIMEQVDQLLPQVSYLYMGGFFKLKVLTPHYPELISKAKDAGVKLIFDHGKVNNIATQEQLNILKESVKEVDFYLPSEQEFLQVWGYDTVEAGLRDLSGKTEAVIVVKMGENGALGMSKDGELVKIEAHPVQVLNAVGAGDSFNAGFIKAHTEGKELRDCVRFGVATSALKISQLALPTLSSVSQLMDHGV